MRRSCLVSLRRVSTAAGGALTGTRVIELEGLAAAPLCGQLLAGHGAEVMRVDRPGRTPHAGTTLLSLGKSSVRIDLKSEKGRRSFEGLIRHADVLIEPYRPGVMERLRLGPDELLEINPRLIYARLTGWGQTGALAHTAGHDINYIATSGALSMFGRPGERPVPPVNLLGDFCGGSLSCAFGISMALFERERSGRGQVIDAAMLDGAAFTTSFIHRLVAARQWDPARPGTNLLDTGAPHSMTPMDAPTASLSLLDASSPSSSVQWSSYSIVTGTRARVSPGSVRSTTRARGPICAQSSPTSLLVARATSGPTSSVARTHVSRRCSL
jgi:crotonobetainyl-CoA:carnitine CoA-transferase CaiB-like acyl-CoA transferase